MNSYYLNCFKDFSCLMGECKHTCCAGWNIKVDKKTYKKYSSLKGEKRKKILSNIDKDTLIIKNKMDGRCPFLTNENLCSIIMELGDKHICSVCTLHPRFKNFFSKRIELGFGVSCEQASNMLINFSGKPNFISDKKATNKIIKKERPFFTFRDKLISIVQNDNISLAQKIELLTKECKVNLYKTSLDKWVKLLVSLEHLDSNWCVKLQGLTDFQPLYDEEFNNEYQNILSYFIFRHSLKCLEQIDVYINSAFAVFCFLIVYNIFYKEKIRDKNTLKEILRSFSAEIEYSENNTEKITEQIELLLSLI